MAGYNFLHLTEQTHRGHHWIHGLSKSPEYSIWHNMKRRCLDPTNKAYARYGGRGITVCTEWIESFEAFYASMGPRPSPKHTLERVLNSQGYSPTNCIWAIAKEQARNTRRNHLITIDGTTKCLTEWLQIYNCGKSTYFKRRQDGWSDIEALTTPGYKHKHKPST